MEEGNHHWRLYLETGHDDDDDDDDDDDVRFCDSDSVEGDGDDDGDDDKVLRSKSLRKINIAGTNLPLVWIIQS